MHSIQSVSIAGSGTVATHLGNALVDAGIQIDYCWNRTHSKALQLANELDTKATESINDLGKSDLILCCISDDALPHFMPVLSEIAPVAAVSGTTNILTFTHTKPIGVFYPLQTFSKGRKITLLDVPFFIECSDSEFEKSLLELAGKLSKQVHSLSWEKRQHLHLAAVLVNNFTNHLADLAQKHLNETNLSFDWLIPLLEETVAKLKEQSAFDAQTGPARRNDMTTIKRHLELLHGKDADVYKILTSSILERYHNDQL